ncbi:MAG: ATP-binding cassette domain-containing protein [candidate division NC10 bacterium]|nr:ATP-binding cassette domain-containing protein [candidate division NC10 bacterium]
MIEVESLTKYYGPVQALADVSFTIEKGEVVGFLGPNGAGKTTTIKILTGFLPATSGRARVAGYDVFERPLEVKRRIGYLPENVPFYPEMRVRAYLDFVASLKGLVGKERKKRVEKVMERCRVADMANKLIGFLSRGYKQRVGLAQALVNDPEVLIFDEPTVGLDPTQIIEIRSLIRELSGARTVFLSTHILSEASALCQRVIIINQGRIVAMDTSENLAGQLQKTARLLVKVEGPKETVQEGLRCLTGVVRVQEKAFVEGIGSYLIETEKTEEIRKALARAVVSNGWGLLELRPADLTLEEVFIKLVSEEQP